MAKREQHLLTLRCKQFVFMETHTMFFKNLEWIVKQTNKQKTYDKETAAKSLIPNNSFNMIVFVLTVTATEKALCRLWSYCLSPGNFLRPSMLGSEDIRILGHFAKCFPLKKKRFFCPGNSIIMVQEGKLGEGRKKGKEHGVLHEEPSSRLQPLCTERETLNG